MTLENISTKTLRQHIYDELRRRIIGAEILPGEVLTLQELAAEFGVSITPVREALRQLESQNVIVIENNTCIYVNEVKPKDVEEALGLRLLLETLAAEKSCERMTDSDLSKVKCILDEMETCLGKTERYLFLNSQFHSGIYSYADSPILLGAIHSLWARLGPYLYLGLKKGGDTFYSVNCHRRMYEALVERDIGKLKEWLCKDLVGAAQIVTRFLENSLVQENGGYHKRRRTKG